MRILSMTATFGCLDEATLSLSDGINGHVLPNESGKSTWAAFVLAMFYGIDTSKRGAKGVLSEKTRYQPWNGKPMSGILELEHEGRIIVLQRTSQRGRPMGAFRAWDKTTGLDLPELTGENCGRYFFGVEKSVFQRTAFLSGSELAVTEDQELARRLENLAVSGSMGDSYPAADTKLKQWKNRCRYHQNGLIPEKEAQLLRAEGRVERLAALRQEALEADETYQSYRRFAERTEREEREDWERKKDASQRNYIRAMERLEQLEKSIDDVPQGHPLETLLEDLRNLEENPMPAAQPYPAPLRGLAGADVMAKAERDYAQWCRLWEKKSITTLWICLTAVGVLGAIAACMGTVWWVLALCLCAAAAGLYALCVIRKHKRQAEELLQAYGVTEGEMILTEGRFREKWLLLEERHRYFRRRIDQFVEQLRSANVEIPAEGVTQDWVLRKMARSDAKEEARQALDAAKKAFIKADEPFPPSQTLMKLRERTAYLKARAEGLRKQEADSGGLEKALYRRDQLQQELDDLYLREQALELAREALEAAHGQLERVYAPRLTGLAGELLRKLTHDRYDALIMGKDWQLQVREQASGLARPLASLSSGTQDQVWLALRLAMAQLLLPADTPLVLDDALLTFDDARAEAALTLLGQTNRQILLFSCKE